MVQHALGGKTNHFDQPVHDNAGTPDREITPALQGERHYPDVYVVRKAAVEPHLLLGVAPPGVSRRKIEAFAAQRLFQLVDVAVGQKYPGEMRFDPLDAVRLLWIGRR